MFRPTPPGLRAPNHRSYGFIGFYRFPLKGSLKGGIDIGIDLDVDIDMNININLDARET